jgi:hypothetical protein
MARPLKKAETGKAKRRYSLLLPVPVYQCVDALAKARGVSVVDVLREFISLGLKIAREAHGSPDAYLKVQTREGKERVVAVL